MTSSEDLGTTNCQGAWQGTFASPTEIDHSVGLAQADPHDDQAALSIFNTSSFLSSSSEDDTVTSNLTDTRSVEGNIVWVITTAKALYHRQRKVHIPPTAVVYSTPWSCRQMGPQQKFPCWSLYTGPATSPALRGLRTPLPHPLSLIGHSSYPLSKLSVFLCVFYMYI